MKRRKRHIAALWLIAGLCLSLYTSVWAMGKATQKHTALLPMTDKVQLANDYYMPEGAGPFPVILVIVHSSENRACRGKAR